MLFGSALLLGSSILPIQAQKLIFAEEFNQTKGSSSATLWDKESHYQGRGKFGGDVYIDGAGSAHIGIGLYHPEPNKFSQTNIRSKRSFAPGTKTLDFKIRCFVPAENIRGIVYGFFLYNEYTAGGARRSDELDIEWLTNLTANTASDKFLASTWAFWNRDNPRYGISQDPVNGTQLSKELPLGINTGSWNTYTIRWAAGKVEWYLDQANGQLKLLGGYYGAIVPTGAQKLFLNAWVPDSSWPQAYSSTINPTSNAAQQKWHSLIVDWVRVYER